MTRPMAILCLVLGVGLVLQAGTNESKQGSAVRLLLSEVQPGVMASEQYCMLVFADRHFHTERANSKLGKDRERKVYEGELSETDWSALGQILDSDQFRKLHAPPGIVPIIIQDAHSYTISVARDNGFQNMEFMDDKSRKPYESRLKPLLQWWKSVRSRHMPRENAAPDSRCTLDSTRGVFSY